MFKYRIALLGTLLASMQAFSSEAQAQTPTAAQPQVLTLKQAIQTALANYPIIKAKANYVKASQASVKEASREYLPDLTLSGQQDYGTVNAQNGPLYSYKGLSASSSGPVLPDQSGAAAFGSLYLANINWDFFSFGRAKERVKVAKSSLSLDSNDLSQEMFEDEVRVAGAYLNLLAAQQLIVAAQSNLDRADSLQKSVLARVKGQLNPGVDSSQANAEVSSAKISLTNAIDNAETAANQLAQLMGVPAQPFVLDSQFVNRIPSSLATPSGMAGPSGIDPKQHPLLKYYEARIALSQEQTKYLRTGNWPTFSLFGVGQGRGTGFDYNYGATNPDAYTQNYWTGVGIERTNYLVGVGVTWNLTSPLRVHQKVVAQQFNTMALANEYDLIDQRLAAQRILAETKIKNALSNYEEAPVQVKAASDAYLQKSVLYKNGLSTIVDLTQTFYVLNRAETDRYIANNNVWQALLFKAAATGDWNLFINEF
jgi:outer membrane protein TolC